jgi:hypothetical protein
MLAAVVVAEQQEVELMELVVLVVAALEIQAEGLQTLVEVQALETIQVVQASLFLN